MEEALAESLSTRRMYSWLLALFAGVALTLAVGGIYGVLSYVVGQRRREIGIRVALGAQRNSVLRLVISQGLLLAGVGLTLGVAGALAVTRLMGSLLFDIDAQDPATFAIVIGVLGLTALIAAYIPARRALRYEPQSVLRE
jgi:putative ABC transport system permease protein